MRTTLFFSSGGMVHENSEPLVLRSADGVPARHRGKEERKLSAQGNNYFADCVAVATGGSWPIGNVTMGRSEGQRDRSVESASGEVAKPSRGRSRTAHFHDLKGTD